MELIVRLPPRTRSYCSLYHATPLLRDPHTMGSVVGRGGGQRAPEGGWMAGEAGERVGRGRGRGWRACGIGWGWRWGGWEMGWGA